MVVPFAEIKGNKTAFFRTSCPGKKYDVNGLPPTSTSTDVLEDLNVTGRFCANDVNPTRPKQKQTIFFIRLIK
jgi:hypothetical protein